MFYIFLLNSKQVLLQAKSNNFFHLRIEASLTSRSSVSDSVVFATLSKETSFRKESGILPNECFALGSHQNTSEKFGNF